MKRLAVTTAIVLSLLPAPAEARHRYRRVQPTPQLLACIRNIESGNNYTAVSRSGRYKGAYQFDRKKWRIWFGDRSVHEVSPEWQDAQAVVLLTLSRKGLRHWPVPNRRCR